MTLHQASVDATAASRVEDTAGVEFEVVIGLEVHVELLTRTKLFCGCPNRFGGSPNTQVCPVCLGLPGTLPVLNRAAVDQVLRAALILDCEIPRHSKFDRKNYFYPDMPRNFQISQYDRPLAVHGHLDVETSDGGVRRVGILRIHLEEDTGKSTHGGGSGRIESAEYTLEDYNRAGVPLAEIVSEPDLASADEAACYLTRLRERLRWAGVSDCKMEEGSLRCDANVSVRPRGAVALGTRAEIKNMNSIRSVARAIEHEWRRQVEVVRSGRAVVQETRAWDEDRGVTHSLRSKEEANDYRYFPEPDLVPLEVDDVWMARIRASLPEPAQDRRRRIAAAYALSDYDATALTRSRAFADFFERVVVGGSGALAKEAANWLLGDVSRLLNANNESIENAKFGPEGLREMMALVEDGVISKKLAKDVLDEMFASGASPKSIVDAHGWRQIGSSDDLRPVVRGVVERHPGVVDDYLGGKEKAFGFLVGQVMATTRGKASPAVANTLLREVLEERRARQEET